MNFDNTQDLFDALSAPFAVEEISWRVGPTNRKEGEALRGQPLCNIDARSVMDRLDSVCGPEGWQTHYTPGVGTSIVCNIGIEIGDQWIWKADGAGATDMEAEKGTLSDAFKRAAVRWGVGRYLYEIKAPWVGLEMQGKFAVIPEAALARLNTLYQDHAKKVAPVIGVHAYRQAYRLLIGSINAMPVEAIADYAAANEALVASMPAQMRDHVLSTIHKRTAGRAA